MSEPNALEEPVTLVSLAGGAAVELFQEEFNRVLKNIDDPNTEAEAARIITLKVTIKPDEDRAVGRVTVAASSKIAGVKPAGSVIYMGRHRGTLVAVEHNPKQIEMFKTPQPRIEPVKG